MIAAVFAYGRVAQILKTLQAIFDRMDESPYAFLLGLDLKRDAKRFQGIVHRFNNGTDILCLMYGMRETLRTYGSLKALFLKGYSPGHSDIEEGLCRFVDHFLDLDYSPVIGQKRFPKKSGFRFLFPSPRNRSACKRLNMYLRWMVRRGDGLDLGLWEEVSPDKLIIPLDTHLFRISARIGLTRRKAADWTTAKEITQNLKLLDPSDPVKYDFSLARLGILQECKKEQDLKQCKACYLHKLCS